MRFSLSIRRNNASVDSNSNSNSNSVTLLRKDIRELITDVLPCCQHRPTVYNQISKVIQQLHEDMRSLGEEPEAVFDFQSPFSEPDEKFVWFLPTKTRNSLTELQKDVSLLDQLWDIPQRRNVRASLLRIRDDLQSDLQACAAIRQKKAQESQRQVDQDREWLAFVLEQVQDDRPHIYNHVVLQMQSMTNSTQQQHRHGSNDYSTKVSRRRRFASLQQHRKQTKKTAPLRWKQEDAPTARNRWDDVVRLDELLDAVPETSLALCALLQSLSKACREEAQALQRAEAGDLESSSVSLMMREGEQELSTVPIGPAE